MRFVCIYKNALSKQKFINSVGIVTYMLEPVTKKEFEELKEEVEHIRENIAILANPELLEKIKEARERFREGKGVTLEKARKEILG